jgi:7 transmembrane receptor (Secretin family)
MVIIGPAIGFPLISFVAITWMTDRIRLRKQYLIFIFICLSAIFTSTFLMVAISGMKNKKFCHDNATEINQMDGITVCTVQAAILVFSFMAFSFCWAIQAVELFCKVVLKRKSKKRIYLHFFIIFILPAGALAYGIFYRSLGYNRVLPFCFISFEPDRGSNNISHDLQFFYIPILFSSAVGTACMVAVVIRIFVSFACARKDPKDHARIAPSGTLQFLR